MKPKIFLLEDDIELSNTVVQFLSANNFEVVQSFDAQDAIEKLYEEHFDLLLLDVKVPIKNGIELLKEIRQDGNETPAIFITSLHGVDDVTSGFEAGCDDYIRKPFALKELLARIEAVIKRHYKSIDKIVRIDDRSSFDTLNFILKVDGNRVSLKPKEDKLLAFFLQNQNKPLTKEEIFNNIWDYNETPNEGSLRTFVKVLRKYLGKNRIETIKDVGYRYVSE
ncbi:response regulator transcription factor [Hydrogenimonas thermophila]|uniref:response regulator transcription factor n=1 Tax=Hydrogenimonas thermophila TaxID=223786 RepID=UPI0029372ACF|nr:response regulator transcription factor [Hydrogenimonas thermophila]WOE69160.1 response regulator transcription factor [Hydrogenimonas thermophila]WOE71670.1 response regulator transcription factor [Hydrogenimonas thermophila]